MASKVHKVRFYNPEPQSINCVSYNKNHKLLAVGRKEATIEIWDLNYAPLMLKFIPGVENGSVEAMGWAHGRLFSTGLGGSLVEWDLDKLCTKKSVLLTGYAAWCLDVDSLNTQVAVGTEQGYINLYSIENDDIIYRSLFDKQEGRIMCCKFDRTGNILVTGSIDNIRVWNVQTGHAVNRISASRRGKEVIVWCLAVLSDNTIVSGDSHGRLTFWDSTIGEQIESFTTHKADILAIAVSEEERSIYCSGVDPTIVNFVKVEMNNKNQSGSHWIKNVQRHVHEHDVRALILQGEKLLSAGADGYLTFSSYPPKWVMRIPPMLPAPRSCASIKKKLLLLRHRNHIEVWKLGTYAMKKNGKLMFDNNNAKTNDNQVKNEKMFEQDTAIINIEKAKKGPALKVANSPLKLASIQTKGKKQLKCCALSPDGKFIIYSTESSIRMLKLEMDEDDDNQVSLSKILINELPVSTCEKVAFTQDSHNVIINSSGTIYILQIDAETGAFMQQTIPTETYLKKSSILHLKTSQATCSGTTYLVAADTSGAIVVWAKTSDALFQLHASLPKYLCIPSAMVIDHRNENLIITYVDQKLVEYDLLGKKIKDWSHIQLPKEWKDRKSAVVSIHTHPQKNNAIIFQDDTSLWILEKKPKQDENSEPEAKKNGKHSHQAQLRIIGIKYLSGFHWVSEDEAVLVEVLPEHIVSQLPPALATKRFAT